MLAHSMAVLQVGTIMRYLLDELTAYEDGFSDILMPDRSTGRHETFMGVHNDLPPLSQTDLREFGAHIVQQVRELLSSKSFSIIR